MLKLSKKVEYGLIAVRHIASATDGRIATAKEIAFHYNISFELISKVLQKLAKNGLVISHQGVNGGYSLAQKAETISISNVIHAVEGHQPALTQCIQESPDSCSIYNNCTIKNPLIKIQLNIDRFFDSMKVSEIV